MTHLLLAILFAVLIFVCFRLISTFKLDEFQVIVANYLVAVMLGTVIWQEPIIPSVIVTKPWFPITIIIGFSFIITFYLFAKSSVKAGIAITAVAGKMSVIIPAIAGFLIFGETVRSLKVVGIILALFSFVLIFYKGKKSKPNFKFIILPLLIFIGTGFNDTLTKYAHFKYLNGDNALFLTTIFAWSFIFSLVFVILKLVSLKKRISLKSLLAGVFVGLVNFGSMYNILASLTYFEASLFFPVLSISVVLITAGIGIVFFKEKLSKQMIAGILVAVLSIVLISANW